jgi:hypothetical protein
MRGLLGTFERNGDVRRIGHGGFECRTQQTDEDCSGVSGVCVAHAERLCNLNESGEKVL